MSAHTPGPWMLRTVPTQVGLCHKVGPFPSRGAKGETFACVYVDGLGLRAEDSPELLANARLIAAAPDLLRCLKEAVASAADADQTADEAFPEDGDPLAEWKAAIAKAEGVRLADWKKTVSP